MRSIFYYILSKINKIQNTTSNITSDVTDLKEDVSTLSTQVGTNTENISSLQTAVGTNTTDITNIKNKSRMSVSITTGQTVHVTESYIFNMVSLNKVLSSFGTAFELITEGENVGKIKVNKNCTVEITGTICNTHSNNVVSIIGIQKNTTPIAYTYDSAKSGTWNTVNITAKPIDVEEGDYIRFVISSDTSNTDIQISTENLFYLYIKEI